MCMYTNGLSRITAGQATEGRHDTVHRADLVSSLTCSGHCSPSSVPRAVGKPGSSTNATTPPHIFSRSRALDLCRVAGSADRLRLPHRTPSSSSLATRLQALRSSVALTLQPLISITTLTPWKPALYPFRPGWCCSILVVGKHNVLQREGSLVVDCNNAQTLAQSSSCKWYCTILGDLVRFGS
jgi:hypothetical protein